MKKPSFYLTRMRKFFAVACLASLPTLACSTAATQQQREGPTLGPPSEPAPLSDLAPDEPSNPVAVEADDARLGDSSALVTVVAFLDFQCAFCKQGFSTLETLRQNYQPSEVRIVFKHLPLGFHEMALPAAVAGQAVMQAKGSQAFFDYARLAFEHQSTLSYQSIGEHAQRAGLERQEYNELVGREETVLRVAQDARLAGRLGVEATPAFYVNGRLIAGAQSIEYFRQVIGEELKKMQSAKGRDWKTKYQEQVAENMRKSVLDALLAADSEDYLVPIDDSATLGSRKAPVTIVVFSDFECPYCKRADATLKLLRDEYGDQLRIVFKHLPLPFHDSARPAALLAEAVHRHKGDEAFFAAAGALFDSAELDRRALQRIGKAHGLSNKQIEEALSDGDAAYSQRLQRDSDLASDVLAHGTPHFFINGKRLSGARPIEQFQALIDHGLERARELRSEGSDAGDVYATLQQGALSPGVPEKLEATPPTDGRPTRGNEDAPVTIHVFSDFECPYCRQGELLLERLEEMYPDDLYVVWHDFPLEFHDRARPAARAGREAFVEKGNDGFWQMHRLLFDLDGESPALGKGDILAHARAVGLDEAALGEAIESEEHDAHIDDDIEVGQDYGIRGTPAYIVGGYLVTGAKPLRFFERLVEKSLKEKSETQGAPAN